MYELTYVYPDLGPVKVCLHAESEQVYSLLTAMNAGERHFARMDQLGALRSVRKSSHHSRWEYMMLQLHLIEELCSVAGLGFGSAVKTLSGRRVTSMSELLKCWVFLSNYGHLKDTLEAERVWLTELLSHPKLKANLLSCTRKRRSRAIANEVLAAQDLFSFHSVLGLTLLEANLRKDRLADQRDQLEMCIDMLQASMARRSGPFSAKISSKLDKTLNAYDAIARLAYIVLDINTTPLFVRTSTPNLIRNILQQPDVVLGQDENEMGRTVRSLENLLFAEVYADAQAAECKYLYTLAQRRAIAGKARRDSIERGLILGANSKMMAAGLERARLKNFTDAEGQTQRVHFCRLTMLEPEPFERSPCRFWSEQRALSRRGGGNVAFVVSPAPGSLSGCVVDGFASPAINLSRMARVLSELQTYIDSCFSHLDDSELVRVWALATPVQQFMLQILQMLVNSDLRARFVVDTSPTGYPVGLVTGRSSTRYIRAGIREFLRDSPTGEGRRCELEVMLERMANKRSPYLVALSDIEFVDRLGNSVAELDGVIVELREESIVLTVIEAKEPATPRSDRCRRALEEKLARLGVQCKGRRCYVRQHHAFVRVGIRDGGFCLRSVADSGLLRA